MIQDRHESKRGCGYRKPGGFYLVSDGPSQPCGKLPVPLVCCPTCGTGIKQARGWTWVNGTALLEQRECTYADEVHCKLCPFSRSIGRAGLIWIGEQYYKTPRDWTREAVEQGGSRRIKAPPRDFKLGETWVLVAHAKCIENPDGTFTAGIFHGFMPKRIEYVVTGDESNEEIEALEKRDITPVRIIRDDQTAESIYDNMEDEE